MKMTNTKKCQFAKLNDKSYESFDGIVSFPFGRPFLSGIRNYKRKAKEKIQKLILEKKELK